MTKDFSSPTVTLSQNGVKMPQFGLGTWLSEKGKVKIAVEHAIKNGYRHIDTAWIYGNEPEVGEGIKAALDAGVCKREDLFIVTKLWNVFHKPEDVERALDMSLRNMKLDYIDQYLMHFPISWCNYGDHPNPMKKFSAQEIKDGNIKCFADIDYVETWHAMEKLIDTGKLRSAGVSNFNPYQINRLCTEAKKYKPAVNQIENNAYLTAADWVKTCQDHGVYVTAYSPLGNPSKPDTRSWSGDEKVLMADPVVVALAEKYKKTAAQICIRFALDRGLIVIPKSVTPARIDSNGDVFDFKLTEAEVNSMLNLNANFRIVGVENMRPSKFFPFKNPYVE